MCSSRLADANLKSSPGRARTYDKRINSPLLYQLSYRGSRKNEPKPALQVDKFRKCDFDGQGRFEAIFSQFCISRS